MIASLILHRWRNCKKPDKQIQLARETFKNNLEFSSKGNRALRCKIWKYLVRDIDYDCWKINVEIQKKIFELFDASEDRTKHAFYKRWIQDNLFAL